MTNIRVYSLALFLLTSSFPLLAGELHVSVASNFLLPLKKLAKAYEEKEDTKIVITSGSTGKLATQVLHGAPYDIFLGADQKRVQHLIKEGKAWKNSRLTYAHGKIVLWGPGMDMKNKKLRQSLQSEKLQHLSLANPKLAPYGKAAQETLKHFELWSSLKEKIILGENVSQAHQFVASGAATQGIISLSQVKTSQPSSSYRLIPSRFHSPIRQAGVIIKTSDKLKEAKRFLNYLKSEKAIRTIHSFGHRSPHAHSKKGDDS